MAPKHAKLQIFIPSNCIVDKIFTVIVKTKNLSRTTRFGLWLFYKDVL